MKLTKAFSINSNGELRETKAHPSALKDDEAVLIVNDANNVIYCWKGPDIETKKRFDAGKAAANLNARLGLKYKIKHVEIGEKEDLLDEMFTKPRYNVPLGVQKDRGLGGKKTLDRLVKPSDLLPKEENLIKPSERLAEIEKETVKERSSGYESPLVETVTPLTLSVEQIEEELMVEAFVKGILENPEIRKRVIAQIDKELLVEAFAKAIVEDPEIRKRFLDKIKKLT